LIAIFPDKLIFAANPILVEQNRLIANDSFYYFCFSTDCTKIVGVGEQSIVLFDFHSYESINSFQGHSQKFLPSGNEMITIGDDWIPRLWNIQTGEIERVYHDISKSARTREIIEISPDGKKMASMTFYGAQIWNLDSGELLCELNGPDFNVRNIRFSADGNRLLSWPYLSSQYGSPGRLILWDVNTGEIIASSKIFSKGIYSANFSPTRNFIIIASDAELSLWNLNLEEQICSIDQSGDKNHISFTPDGMHFLMQASDVLQLWEIAENCSFLYKICDIQNQLNVWEIAKCFEISPDGQQVWLSQNYNNIQLWNLNLDTPTLPTPTSIPTPTPIPPTPTPNHTLQIHDNRDSVIDLSGQTDFDASDNRNLTIAWQTRDSITQNVRDWHIYVREWIGGMRFLGRTGDGAADHFDWYPRAPQVTPEFSDGPQFNSLYQFRVVRIDDLLDPWDYFEMNDNVGFNIEGGGEVQLPELPMPNLYSGQIDVYDDLLGGNELAQTGSVNGYDEDPADSRAIQLVWKFGAALPPVNDYHVFVRVNGGNWQFLGRTGSGRITYYWWTPYNKFITAAAFTDGPQDEYTYQFMVFLIPFEGERMSLTSGVLRYVVVKSE
jgi:WD40 repeat protein